MKHFLSLAAVFVAISATWAAETTTKTDQAKAPASGETKTAGPAVSIDLGPIHNGFRLGKKIISGSCPYGEAGFKMLADLGVKTIISVDGARPDEPFAQKFGMRYVHIPVPYSGITRANGLKIARAVRDLPGPVFIHCHHGKHRGPTAAVLAAMVNEGWTTQNAQDAMKQAGTSSHYKGLWGAARDWKLPTSEELDATDATFPASAPVPATAEAMVSIDERWEHLNAVKAANWQAPADHPDIDPAHEALLLREEFRELHRAPETAKFPTDYAQMMRDSETASANLESALREKKVEKAQTAFTAIGNNCKSCHASYRDVTPNTKPDTGTTTQNPAK